MFSEHKKKTNDKKEKGEGNLKFDELEAKTKKMKIGEDGKKEKKYHSTDELPLEKKRSIKKSDQKPSTTSLKGDESSSSKPIEKMGFGIFEAATMMRNIVDITTDSTTTNPLNRTKQLKSKNSKTSLGPLTSGPFAQMKEAQEMKKKKQSFDQDDEDTSD
ncbi:unnamed protein product [Caenorhabditis bovis]|uniref:Uncharacterized protein n=1 Tax=Caenorhabditis bovis TaxID=2654633 RepID=A0A8S1EPN0_9PELO|nr:unnamed protein product [Caenorhabditis bovis]